MDCSRITIELKAHLQLGYVSSVTKINRVSNHKYLSPFCLLLVVGAIVAIVAVTIVSIALVICAIVGIVVVAFVLVVVVVLDVQAMVKIARNLISRPCNTFLTF